VLGLRDRFPKSLSPGQRCGTGSAADGGAGSSTASEIDEQAGYGVRHGVERRLHRWQRPELLAVFVVGKAQLQDDTPLRKVFRPFVHG
jgi:hypothetical protein